MSGVTSGFVGQRGRLASGPARSDSLRHELAALGRLPAPPGRLGCKSAPALPLPPLSAKLLPAPRTSQVMGDKPFLAAFTGFHGTTSALHRAAGERAVTKAEGRCQHASCAALPEQLTLQLGSSRDQAGSALRGVPPVSGFGHCFA